MNSEKKCSQCDQIKGFNQFYKQKHGLYGLTGECKECRKIRSKTWSMKFPESALQSNRKRNKTESRKKYKEEWIKNNPDYFKNYRKENREKQNEVRNFYLKLNPERCKAYSDFKKACVSGEILRKNKCDICNSNEERIMAFHEDVFKIYDVKWLCVSCRKKQKRKTP